LTQGIKNHGLLLVDTDVAFRDELSVALERFDVAIVWRARVKGLLETVAETHPIAIVLSADLAGNDPIELLRAIRRQARTSDLAVYVVGSALTRETVLRAYVEGADAVLTRDAAVAEIAARVLGRMKRLEHNRRDDGRSVADAALDLCEATEFAPPAEATAPAGAAQPAEAARAAVAAPPTASAVDSDNPFVFTDDPGSAEAIADAIARAAEVGRPTEPGSVEPAKAPELLGVPIGVSPPTDVLPQPTDTAWDNFGIRPATPVAVPDVIIVEDDPSLLEMLRYALTNRGYQTLSFSNGLDALRALREMDTASQQPVVLLDVDLPGIDGFRILHELSGSRPGAYQIILCTIHNSEATQVLGIQSGALDYLVKPLRMPIVLAKVEALIGRGSFNATARSHGR